MQNNLGQNQKGDFRGRIEKIERLEEQKKAIADDIRDEYKSAGSQGYDVKAMRRLIALRKKGGAEAVSEHEVLSVYMHALGMLNEVRDG
jgi:uncharacterized protein (UPF0335 family)